jgi:hypothetical protein
MQVAPEDGQRDTNAPSNQVERGEPIGLEEQVRRRHFVEWWNEYRNKIEERFQMANLQSEIHAPA